MRLGRIRQSYFISGVRIWISVGHEYSTKIVGISGYHQMRAYRYRTAYFVNRHLLTPTNGECPFLHFHFKVYAM